MKPPVEAPTSRQSRPPGSTPSRVEVEAQPTHDCDFRVVSDYADALAIARDPDAPVAQPSMMEQRMAEGRLKIVGDPADVPATLAGLDIHRLLSSRTL